MKRFIAFSAVVLAGVLAASPTGQARDRTADANAPLVVRDSMFDSGTVGRRGNKIFLFDRGRTLERTTLVTTGPAVIAEAPLRHSRRARVVRYQGAPVVIAERPIRAHRRMLPAWGSRTTFLTSTASGAVVVERPLSGSSQLAPIAEGPVKKTFIRTSQPAVISEGSTFEVEKGGGLKADGLSLAGRGPHFIH